MVNLLFEEAGNAMLPPEALINWTINFYDKMADQLRKEEASTLLKKIYPKNKSILRRKTFYY